MAGSNKKLKISDTDLSNAIQLLFARGKLTPTQIGAVPDSRTVNALALTSNISVALANIAGTIVQSSNATVNMSSWGQILALDCSSSAILVTLPAPVSAAQHVLIVKTDSSTNAVNIQAHAGSTLNGSTVAVVQLPAQWNACIIASDGTTNCWQFATNFGGGGGGGGVGTFSSVGVGTVSPSAAIDVEAWTITPLVLTNGVTNCVCDQFGFPNFLQPLTPSSLLVQSPLPVSIAGSSYSLSSPVTLSGLSSYVNYIYMDDTSAVVAVSNVSPEVYTERTTMSAGMYLNFDGSLNDSVYNSRWQADSSSALTFVSSSPAPKFGSQCARIQNTYARVNIAAPQPYEINSTRPQCAACSEFQIDFWVQPGFTSAGTYQLFGADNVIGLNLITANSLHWFWSGTLNDVAFGSAPANQWNYIGIRYAAPAQLTLNVNGATTSFTAAAISNSGTALQGFIGCSFASSPVFFDEFIFTPFVRPWQAISAFNPTAAQISTYGTSFASYLSGQSLSLTDAYGFQWFSNGYSASGANHNGVATLPINSTTCYYTHFSPNFSMLPEWTIEGWFNVASVAGASNLIDMRGHRDLFRLVVSISSPTTGAISASSNCTSNNIMNNVALTFPTAGTWFHLAVCYGASSTAPYTSSAPKPGYYVYINGVLAASSAITAPICFSSRCCLGYGYGLSSATSYWTGFVGEFRMTPLQLYPNAFTPPASALGVNTNRDLFDTTLPTPGYIAQGAGGDVPVSRVYLGSYDTQRFVNSGERTMRVVHYASRQNLATTLASGSGFALCRDGATISNGKSWSITQPKHVNSQLGAAFVRQDGRVASGGFIYSTNSWGYYPATTPWTISPAWTMLPFNGNADGAKIKLASVTNQCNIFVDTLNRVYVNGNLLGNVWSNSYPSTSGALIYQGTNITQAYITCCTNVSTPIYNLYILDDGDLYVCGQNTYGQLGIGSTSTSLAQLTLVARQLGEAWAASLRTASRCLRGRPQLELYTLAETIQSTSWELPLAPTRRLV